MRKVVVYLVVFIFSIGVETICRDQRWFQDSSYCLLEKEMPQENGSTICSDMGGTLSVPDSLEEREVIWEMFTDTVPTGNVWIGCTWRKGMLVRSGEAGKVCRYTSWAPGEPYHNGNCVCLWRDHNGKMDDTPCSLSYFVICESPALPMVTPGMSCLQAYADARSPNHCLTGHVIKEFSTKGAIACGSVCRDEPGCKSFHLLRGSRGEKICQLNNISRYVAEERDIKLDNSCNYFNILTKMVVYFEDGKKQEA